MTVLGTLPTAFSARNKNLADPILPLSYYTCQPMLDAFGFLDQGGNLLWKNKEEHSDFAYLFLPSDQTQWTKLPIMRVTEEECVQLEQAGFKLKVKQYVENEFFFETKTFLLSKGKLASRSRQFKKKFPGHLVSNSWPQAKLLPFYEKWRAENATNPKEEFFLYCLDNLNRYPIKQVYVSLNNELIGFAWGIAHQTGGWIGLHLKALYDYPGLSRFLHQERAKLFKDLPDLTLGPDGDDPGIAQYKQELGPSKIAKYFYTIVA